MPIQIVSYEACHEAAVGEFNSRLRAGGGTMFFPEGHVPDWLPRRGGSDLYQEYFLAVAPDSTRSEVRGGYVLKHQRFLVQGCLRHIADYRLPLSEGIVDRRYALLGVQLMHDALRRQPLLFGLGIGGYEERLTQLLQVSGWWLTPVPFFFRVVHPTRFLRNVVYLRKSLLRRCLLDFLAVSGAGWLGTRLLHAIKKKGSVAEAAASAEAIEEFGDWADQVWDDSKDDYGFCAVRDAAVLRSLYPAEKANFIRLRVRRQSQTIGWAVLLDTQLANHKHFGNMRLGTLVDCFARGQDAAAVVTCARRDLESRGVDLIVSNQSHDAWCRALDATGFLRGPSNYLFASSKQLTELLGPPADGIQTFHLTRGDGDGPIHL